MVMSPEQGYGKKESIFAGNMLIKIKATKSDHQHISSYGSFRPIPLICRGQQHDHTNITEHNNG